MTLQATFCATLVDEWARGGVTHAVIAPGSRSAPLAIALIADGRIEVHVRLDERSAAFFALGIALESGAPVVVLTTSGTAAAELHAAVLEADLARVPLIVATADRPFELHRVGAPQTVEQAGLFGGAVRLALDPGVPMAEAAGSWRSLASRLVLEAVASPRGPGPVHVNLAFRDPLVGRPDPLPPGRADGRPWHVVVADRMAGADSVEQFVASLAAGRGVVVVGGPIDRGVDAALGAFAGATGWPVIADPRAIRREVEAAVIAHADGILGSPVARTALAPEVVVHIGSPHASKRLGTWCAQLAGAGVRHLLIDPDGAFEDPDRAAALVLRTDPATLLRAAATRLGTNGAADPGWLRAWRDADDAAAGAICDLVEAEPAPTEPGIARAIVGAVPDGSIVFTSSSMPVRDVEWFAAARNGAPRVLANRGANGIDGVTSTILGVATSVAGSSTRVVGLLGDLALLYDLSGLVFGTREAVPDATLVVIDNGGGGIFSFLPYPGVLDDDDFERAFATPQRPDIAATVRGLGHAVVECTTTAEVADAVRAAAPGVTVVVVRTDRAANVALHHRAERQITAAVEAALAQQ